tara:strand:- start:2587 stop:3093 length:507 start_codon:yes stop_codon:yes gene_type:complete
MYDITLEEKLISSDITEIMQDYVSIQLDIDNTKIKAAALVAQAIDITRVITKANLDRVIGLDIYDENVPAADLALRELILAPWCYYTYARCLTMFQGTFTDSGYATETEAESRNAAKSVGQEMKAIGDSFMISVVEFLEAENPYTKADDLKLSPRIRAFGGKENRGSN